MSWKKEFVRNWGRLGMKFNWTTKKLSEIAYINPRESIGKGVVAKKVSMDKLQPFCRDVPEFVFEEYKGGAKFRNNDTIMARITPCLENGKIAKVSILDNDEIGFGSTEYIVFRAIDGVSDADFLYYLICSPLVRNPAIKSMVGSSGRQRVQTDVVANLDIELPPIEEQRKIGGLLKTFDNKIKLNNEINNNLEQQAVLLFKKWFIEFDNSSKNMLETRFGLIPESFKLLKNGELPLVVTDYVANGSFASLKANVTLYQEPNYAYFIRNTDLKSGTFEVFVDEHSYNFLSKSTLYGGEIIISNVGDVGSVFLCPKLDKPMTLGNNIIMLRPEQENLRYYLYIWFKWLYGQSLIQGIKGGSAQPKFNKTDFKNLPIFLPPDDLLEQFHQIVKPMFELIDENNAENKALTITRDTLSPRLMFGELDVSDIDL